MYPPITTLLPIKATEEPFQKTIVVDAEEEVALILGLVTNLLKKMLK
jgi:hypothetical protein